MVVFSTPIAAGPNPSGLPYARISRIDGRSDDILTLPAPGGGQVAVAPLRLRAPFATLPDIRQYQILHDRRGLQVRVVLHPGGPADTLTGIQDTLTRELRAAGALPPPIRVVPVAEIQREGGHGAKLKLVKRSPSPSPD